MPRRIRENTLPSFAAALDAGADGIELDVHATSDGVVVVHHDAHTADGREIARTGWPDLRRSGAGDLAIPTLAAVCELVGHRAELLVEIKGAGIERQVVEALRDHDGPVAVHSFDHAAIERISRFAPGLRLGLLFEDPVPDVAGLLSARGARDAWPRHAIVDAPLVAAVHRLSGRVIPWTVNDARDVERLTTLGVDGICTDDVTLLDRR